MTEPYNGTQFERFADARKEQTYREFWAGERPGTLLVNASVFTREMCFPPPPTGACAHAVEPCVRHHLACELERLDSRDWGVDDAVPAVVVPVGPTGTLASAFGSSYDPAFDWTTQCLRTPEEIRRLQPPQLSAGLAGRYLEQVRCTGALVGNALPVCFGQCLQGPLSTSAMILDDQVLLEAMYTHPQDVHRLLEMVTQFIIDFTQTARQMLPRPVPTNFSDMYFPDGLGVCLSDDLAAVVSPWLYEEFVVPYMNRISDTFGGLLLHSCGNPAMNYPVLSRVHTLRGIDVGATECPAAEVLEFFSGRAVTALHVGLNTQPHFTSRLACVEHILKHVRPGSSVFINASSHAQNLPPTSRQAWNDESRRIVDRVRARQDELNGPPAG